MRIPFVVFLFVVVACASKPRQPASIEGPLPAVTGTAAPASLTLEQALQQGAAPTLAFLKSQSTAKNIEGLEAKNPASFIPATLKAERPAPASKDKNLQWHFIQKFRAWTFAKKSHKAEELLTDFNCGNALETQALGYSLEIDFPLPDAVSTSRALHEKVLSCQAFSRQESLFRLAIFSIQKGECPKAIEYLDQFPAVPERGVNDRLAYLRSLCSAPIVVNNRNPWGGYGILLKGPESVEASPQWTLSAKSGDEEWDRLLVSYMELYEKGQVENIQFIATKINYEKFRSLPLAFQTSVLVLMNYAGADLPVFQTLHRYLSEHPDMVSPSVVGLLFPIRYWEKIVEQSKTADPVLVKALIRQESAFNPQARSRAKAAGLMQLIYPTAKVFGIKKPKELLSPEANIHAGSEFLAQLIRDFGSVELALAAYNAGPAAVRKWQKRYPTDNMELFVEMIPYSETREYVRLVRRNYKIYQAILVKPQVVGGVLP